MLWSHEEGDDLLPQGHQVRPSGRAAGLHPTRTALQRVSLLSNRQHTKWIEIKAKSS